MIAVDGGDGIPIVAVCADKRFHFRSGLQHVRFMGAFHFFRRFGSVVAVPAKRADDTPRGRRKIVK